MDAQKTNIQPELRVPVIIPDTRQIIMLDNSRLPSIAAAETSGGPIKTAHERAIEHFSDRKVRSLKTLGVLPPINDIQGYAMYHEIGQPLEPFKGHIDPSRRLQLFSLDRLLEQKRWPHEEDMYFIRQAASMLHEHIARRP